MNKTKRNMHSVERDPEFDKLLSRYQAEIAKAEAVKLKNGPAIRRIVIEYLRARYPQNAKSATT